MLPVAIGNFVIGVIEESLLPQIRSAMGLCVFVLYVQRVIYLLFLYGYARLRKISKLPQVKITTDSFTRLKYLNNRSRFLPSTEQSIEVINFSTCFNNEV